MRKIVFAALAATSALAAASPAFAGDTRMDVHYGVVSSQGSSSDVGGVSFGHDIDTSFGFVGIEGSVDKVFDTGTRVAMGFTGRAGVKVGGADRLFGAAGYTTKYCSACDGAMHLGTGYERQFDNGLYGKVEYRHFLLPHHVADADSVAVGVGFRF